MKMMKRKSLLASFLAQEASSPVALFSLSGRDLSSLLASYSEYDALTSDMVAIGEDMHKVLERINIEE